LLGKAFTAPIKTLIKFSYRFLWRNIIIKLYNSYIKIKRWIKSKHFHRHSSAALLTNNKIVAVLIAALITSLVTTNNLSAKELSRDELGKSSLIFQLIEDEFGKDVIITDSKPALVNPVSYLETANTLQNIPNTNEQRPPNTPVNEEIVLSQSGSVLVKQHFTAPNQPPTRTQVEEYIVKPGDTISSIASRFGLKINTLLWSNKLSKSSIIRPGDKLTIPPEDGLRQFHFVLLQPD